MVICKYDKCTKHASSNLPGLKSPIFCATHKMEGMINVVSKKCADNIDRIY